MECRPGCGACCVAPSISSSIPGMPVGKPAGVRCINLDPKTWMCRIWETPDYPKVCREFRACEDTCGTSRDEALSLLALLEAATGPG